MALLHALGDSGKDPFIDFVELIAEKDDSCHIANGLNTHII